MKLVKSRSSVKSPRTRTPKIQIEEPTVVDETSFVVVNVEINDLSPSTSTHGSSNSHTSSEKQYIEVPTRSSMKKKVRWEGHRVSEESVTQLYPYSNTTSTRDNYKRRVRAPSFDDDTPPILKECRHVLKLIILVSICSTAIFLVQCLMYFSYVAFTGDLIEEIIDPKEYSRSFINHRRLLDTINKSLNI